MSNKIASIQKEKQRDSSLSSTIQGARILIAEDDREMRLLLVKHLSKEGYHITECKDGLQLLERLSLYLFPEEKKGESFDLIITDNRMPCLMGLEVLAGMRRDKKFPPLILITAFGDVQTYREARDIGAVAVFNKPFDLEDLSNKIRKTLQMKKGTKR